MLIRENIEVPQRIATDSSKSIVNGQVPVLDLLEHNRKHHHVVNGCILNQINLQNQSQAQNHFLIHSHSQ